MNKKKSSETNDSNEEITNEDERVRDLFKLLGTPDFKMVKII